LFDLAMHWFQLWVESVDAEGACRLKVHFHGFQHDLLNGRTIAWFVEDNLSRESPPGVTVIPSGLAPFGPRTIHDALEHTEVGIRLFHRLLKAPEFRIAIVGMEADLHMYDDLQADVIVLRNGERRFDSSYDCVMNEALWMELGRPTNLIPFRPGYRWTEFRGSFYRPFGSNDHKAAKKADE
jgi:hypothetical protein